MVPKHVAVTLCRHRYRFARSLGAHRVLRALGAPVPEEVEEEEDALDGIPEDGDETWERNATKAINRGPGRNLKEKAVTARGRVGTAQENRGGGACEDD